MTISADNFWIELERLLGAPATSAQMEALMENYGPVWPDIHERAINSPDDFKSLTSPAFETALASPTSPH
jgi:hypothetical protein